MLKYALLLALNGLVPWAVAQDEAPMTLDRIREAVVPTPEELRWQEIPWRPTLWAAVLEAQEKDRPILLWAMNGHPLACT